MLTNCFIWIVTAGSRPAKVNVEKISIFEPFKGTFDVSGKNISIRMQLNEFLKFKKEHFFSL